MATRTAVITSQIAISNLLGQEKEKLDSYKRREYTPSVAFIDGYGKTRYGNIQRVISQPVFTFIR